MPFEFATTHRIVFGPGTLRDVGSIASEFGERPLVVTGSNPNRAERLFSRLKEKNLSHTTFSVRGEPETTTIEQGVADARRNGCDMVISFGGGSVLDSGK